MDFSLLGSSAVDIFLRALAVVVRLPFVVVFGHLSFGLGLLDLESPIKLLACDAAFANLHWTASVALSCPCAHVVNLTGFSRF